MAQRGEVLGGDPNFSPVWFQASKADKGILLHVSDFKGLQLHLSRKRMRSSPLEKANGGSNIIARNSFLKTEVDYSALLDAFTLDTA